MKLNKPKFWDKKNSFISILLLPFTLVIIFFIFLKKKFTFQKNFQIPIVCVGNIYVGGTGKTPCSIFIAQELKKLGKKPVIIKKLYDAHKDEHNLVKNYFPDLILKDSRTAAIDEAKRKNYDIVILDDGLQDYKIKKNLKIVCFSQKQLIGNGYVFPSGPLRESLYALKKAHIILINGKKDLMFERKILNINKDLEIFYSNYEPQNIKKFQNKEAVAIAGIGNPSNFFDLLSDYKVILKEKMSYPDHYKFNKDKLSKIVKDAKEKGYEILMTEKDYFRIKDFDIKNINFIKVELRLNQKEKFLRRVFKVYD